MTLARLGALAALCLAVPLASRMLAQIPASSLASALGPAHALGQGSQLEISMEELVNDSWNNQIVARGNVEIRYYGEILVADEVAYDRSTRKLRASGHVSLTDAEGKVTRTDSLNLNDELRDAFVAYVRRQRMPVGP
jgi:LPS-assembly protein